MPIPVQFVSSNSNSPPHAIGFLPELPTDFAILCYTVTILTTTSIALRGPPVFRHFLRQPLNVREFDFRLLGPMAYNHLNKLKDVAKYSGNQIYLCGYNFEMAVFEDNDGPTIRLVCKINGSEVIFNIYDSIQTANMPLDSLEIIFSNDSPTGLIKLENKNLIALTRYLENKPQICCNFRQSFNPGEGKTNSFDNIMRSLYHISKYYHSVTSMEILPQTTMYGGFGGDQSVGQLHGPSAGMGLLHFERLPEACQICPNLGQIQNLQNLGTLRTLGYVFKCGHKLCVVCILKLVKKFQTGSIRCPQCQESLKHHETDTQSINYQLLKSLFTSYYEFDENELNKQKSEFSTFKTTINDSI